MDELSTMPWFLDGSSYFPFSSFFCCNKPAVELAQPQFAGAATSQSIQLLVITAVTIILDTVARYAWGADGGIAGALWLQCLNPFSQLCLIVALTRAKGQSIVSSVLRHKAAQWLGKLSMSIYPVHFVFLFYLRWIVANRVTLSWPAEFDCDSYDAGSAKRQRCNHDLNEYNKYHEVPDWAVFVVTPLSILAAQLLVSAVEEPIRKRFRG